jgi:hypothetical protein
MKKTYPHKFIYPEKNRQPEAITIIDKRLFLVVDRKNKPIAHRNGNILPFFRKRDAEKWLIENDIDGKRWRIVPIDATLIRA